MEKEGTKISPCCVSHQSPKVGIELGNTAVICPPICILFCRTRFQKHFLFWESWRAFTVLPPRYAAMESALIKHSYQMAGIRSGRCSCLRKHRKTRKQRQQWIFVQLGIQLLSSHTVNDSNKLSSYSINDLIILFRRRRWNQLFWFVIITAAGTSKTATTLSFVSSSTYSLCLAPVVHQFLCSCSLQTQVRSSQTAGRLKVRLYFQAAGLQYWAGWQGKPEGREIVTQTELAKQFSFLDSFLVMSPVRQVGWLISG